MYVHVLYIYIYICTHQGAYLLQSKAFLPSAEHKTSTAGQSEAAQESDPKEA